MLKISVFTALLLSLTAFTAFAQAPDQQSERQHSEMKKFAPMVGAWEGEGWIKEGDKIGHFTGGEIVQWKVDGIALLVEGLHKSKPTDKEPARIIHETLAVISFEPKNDVFRFRTFLATGSQGGSEIRPISSDTFEWGFSFPGGKMKYTIKLTDKTWFEIGEYIPDGKPPVKFFEMTLQKRK